MATAGAPSPNNNSIVANTTTITTTTTTNNNKNNINKAQNSGEAELKGPGLSWDTRERLDKDRTTWRNFVAALNADRR